VFNATVLIFQHIKTISNECDNKSATENAFVSDNMLHRQVFVTIRELR